MTSEALSGADQTEQIAARSAARIRRVFAIALLLLLAAALPFLVSNYRTFQLTLMIAYAIALLGLNILTGYNGPLGQG
jgi:branched-chain amino acid transport system permease protein